MNANGGPRPLPAWHAVLRELVGLFRASFRHEGDNASFLPFEAYPSSFRPPLKPKICKPH